MPHLDPALKQDLADVLSGLRAYAKRERKLGRVPTALLLEDAAAKLRDLGSIGAPAVTPAQAAGLVAELDAAFTRESAAGNAAVAHQLGVASCWFSLLQERTTPPSPPSRLSQVIAPRP